MNNHVHWLLTPTTPKGLARLFQRVHTWWAVVFNRKHERTGHLFQNRYHSSPLDEKHYWEALRYVELNPKTAGLVNQPDEFLFSSAKCHLTGQPNPRIRLAAAKTRRVFSIADWRIFLRVPDAIANAAIRRAAAGSRPCGEEDWMAALEQKYDRKLAISPPGRPAIAPETLSAA